MNSFVLPVSGSSKAEDEQLKLRLSPHTPFSREMTQMRLFVRVEVTMKHEGTEASGGFALPTGHRGGWTLLTLCHPVLLQDSPGESSYNA